MIQAAMEGISNSTSPSRQRGPRSVYRQFSNMRASSLNARNTMLISSACLIAYFGLPEEFGALKTISTIIPCIYLIFQAALKSNFSKEIFHFVNNDAVHLFYIFILISAFGVLLNQHLDFYAVRKFILILSVILMSGFKLHASERDILIFGIILFLIGITLGLMGVQNNFSSLSDVSESTVSPFESVFGLAMAVFAIWFFARRRMALTMLFFALSYIMHKRNAIGAAIIAIFIIQIFKIFNKKFEFQSAKFTLIITLIISLYTSLHMEEIFNFLADHIRGANPENISTGRSVIYGYIYQSLDRSTLLQWAFGHGAGSVERYLSMSIARKQMTLAHNEYLSILYDFGILGVLLFFPAFFNIFTRKRGDIYIGLSISIMMVVENIFFISALTIPMMILISCSVPNKSRGLGRK